jgi:hypothetical protein
MVFSPATGTFGAHNSFCCWICFWQRPQHLYLGSPATGSFGTSHSSKINPNSPPFSPQVIILVISIIFSVLFYCIYYVHYNFSVDFTFILFYYHA